MFDVVILYRSSVMEIRCISCISGYIVRGIVDYTMLSSYLVEQERSKGRVTETRATNQAEVTDFDLGMPSFPPPSSPLPSPASPEIETHDVCRAVLALDE